jgi:ribosome-associated inhibitor A
METQITHRHAKASPEIKELIEEKLAKLEKFHDKITSCHVILDTEHPASRIAEVVMNVQGQTLTVKSKSEAIGKSIDEALEKIERRLKKLNEKIKDHKAPKPLE